MGCHEGGHGKSTTCYELEAMQTWGGSPGVSLYLEYLKLQMIGTPAASTAASSGFFLSLTEDYNSTLTIPGPFAKDKLCMNQHNFLIIPM